jgi:alkylation response protein AidB-like acyl-CoA dehydrogenase
MEKSAMSKTLDLCRKPEAAAYATAADLERFFGDPGKPGTPFSYREIVEHEENDELPAGALEMMRQRGVQNFLVPVDLGGSLGTFDELFQMIRVVSRRNLTLAIRLGSTFLGALPTWLWGSPQQKDSLAKEILSGGVASFGVSEADHGSDIVGNDTVAKRAGAELVLTGAKWPIGNATRARFVTVLARIEDGRRFSLILVDKEQVDSKSWSALPLVKTVGLRGHDLSGITFDGCRVPASAVIGPDGAGLGQTLKLLQITRTAVSALSLGTMDATVRIALAYAHERRLYGRPIFALPAIRDHLLRAHIDLLIGDCVATPAARALSLAPTRLSLWSSVVKYLVPVMAEEVVAGMATVLGARSFLREGVADGAFQKLQRDHAIASIFEGTTHVNLQAITHQLPFVLAGPQQTDEQDRIDLLTALFSRTEDSPTWSPNGSSLRLANEGMDEITHSWGWIRRQVESLAHAQDPVGVHRDVRELVAELEMLRSRCYATVAKGDSASTRALAVASKHCVFHAAASCLLTWLGNREALGGRFADGHWLVLCLHRLIQRLDPDRELPEAYMQAIEAPIVESLRNDTVFSIMTLDRPNHDCRGGS